MHCVLKRRCKYARGTHLKAVRSTGPTIISAHRVAYPSAAGLLHQQHAQAGGDGRGGAAGGWGAGGLGTQTLALFSWEGRSPE